MLDVIWDMETGDPDDFFTLMLLLGHSEVNLKAVTITPGAEDQIGLVRKVLKDFKADIPIGAFNIDHPKKCVSGWYHKVYGEFVPSKDAELGKDELSIQRTLAIKDCKNKELSNYQRGRIDALQEILKMIDP